MQVMNPATLRSTPAYTGKILNFLLPGLHIWEHPRVYGENLVEKISSDAVPGAPPRIRGKFRNECNPGIHERSTPAYTGKIVRSNQVNFCTKEHPRVYGENQLIPTVDKVNSRSTPAYTGKILKKPLYISVFLQNTSNFI